MPHSSRTLADLLPAAAERWPDAVAVRRYPAAAAGDVTYAQLRALAANTAAGLAALGVGKGDRVVVFSPTRSEWMEIWPAIAALGAVLVPSYHTNSAEQCAWILQDSGASVAIVDGAERASLLESVADRAPALRHIVAIEPAPGCATLPTSLTDPQPGPSATLPDAGAVDASDPFLVCYTSGSTGRPKGCVLLHGNLEFTTGQQAAFEIPTHGDVVQMWLPNAHIFGIYEEIMALRVGATLVFGGSDGDAVLREAPAIRPTYIPVVPRIVEKIYADATRGADPDDIRAAVAAMRSTAAATRADGDGAWHDLDRRIFAPARELLGDRVRVLPAGAAPLDPEMAEFFFAAGMPVLDFYGSTEVAGIVSLCTPSDYRQGSVGRLLPGVQARIAADGEVLVKSPGVFAGYLNQPEATAEVMTDDGWFRTGDLGRFDDDGYLFITGRKKELIITAGGKNVSPGNWETRLAAFEFVQQACVYGDRRPYLVALITLSRDVAPAAVARAVESVNSEYASPEQVKRFAVLDERMSVEGGELTPSLKMKRQAIYDKYADLIASLYEGEGAP